MASPMTRSCLGLIRSATERLPARSLRVDPDNGLVITMGRFNAGNNYDAHLSAFMKVIEECLN